MNGLLQYVVDFDPPRARASDPKTSKAAASSVVEGLTARSRKILLTLNNDDMNGSELDQHFGWLNNTAVRLLARLRRAGLIEGVGESPTVTGRMAQQYRTTAKGVRACT